MRVRLIRQVVEISYDGQSSVPRWQTVSAELRFEREPRPLKGSEIAGQWQVVEELSPEAPAIGTHHLFVPPEDESVGPDTRCAAPFCGQPRSAEVHEPD